MTERRGDFEPPEDPEKELPGSAGQLFPCYLSDCGGDQSAGGTGGLGLPHQ